MKLTVVRHGETTANRDRITQGQLDTELTELGMKQARTLAEELRNEDFDRIVTSDLRRCLATAAQIGQYHSKLPILQDARFREYSFGEHQGKPTHTWDWPDAVNDRDTSAKAPGGESAEDVSHRLVDGINESYRAVGPDGHMLLVAHGGIIRLLRVLTGEIEFHERMQDKIGNCSAWKFDIAEPLKDLRALQTAKQDPVL